MLLMHIRHRLSSTLSLSWLFYKQNTADLGLLGRLRPPRAAQTQKQLLRTVCNYHVFLRSLTAVCGHISKLEPRFHHNAYAFVPKKVKIE